MPESADAEVRTAAPMGEAPRALDGPLGTLLKQCRRSFYFVALLTAVIEVLSLSPIIYILNLYDRVLSSRSEVTLISLLLLIAGVYVFWSVLDWVRTRMMIRISLRMDWDLAASVFDASFRRYLGQKKVNVHKLLGELLKIRQFLTGEPILALFAAPFSIVFVLVAATFHIYLAIFAIVAMIILFVSAYLTKELSTPVLKAANDASAEANRLAAQSLRSSEAAFALGMQTNIRRQWHQRHQSFLELQVNASEAAGVLGGLTSFLSKLLPSMQISLAIWLAISGHITGGMVIAAHFLLSRALQPIRTVLSRWSEIAAAREAYYSLNQLLMEDEAGGERMHLPPPAGQLRVRDLCVTPPQAKQPVLHDISFALDQGQALAVLGPSASGKSTLARALVGLWAPQTGSVRLDGAEVSSWLRGDLGQHVGYVPQDIDFFEGTVAENVARLGEVEAEAVIAATESIGLHAMVLAFPKGYETMLGEHGHPLTGGQKQRLAIARAFYGNPRYLVLDEPDASLDDTGQQALLKFMRDAKARRSTVIFSTHRPELLEVADKVLVLNEGRLYWFGTLPEFRNRLKQPQPAPVPRRAVDSEA